MTEQHCRHVLELFVLSLLCFTLHGEELLPQRCVGLMHKCYLMVSLRTQGAAGSKGPQWPDRKIRISPKQKIQKVLISLLPLLVFQYLFALYLFRSLDIVLLPRLLCKP